MQTRTTETNKPASVGILCLLFLAGVTGASVLLPLQSVHAATPAVALSTIAGGVKTPAASGTVGSSLVITGTGFAAGSTIRITSTVGGVTVDWLTTGTCTTAGGGTGSADSLVTSSGGSRCLTASANADFQVMATVPAMPGGPQAIVVSDGANSASAPFTITPSLTLTVGAGDLNYGFPEQNIGSPTPDTFSVRGFGAFDTVTLTTTAFTPRSLEPGSCVASILGSCTISESLIVAEQNGGVKSITATGGTSGLSASTTYLVRPWAAFYDSLGGPTTFSFLGSAPTSLLVEAHGMAAGTIAANSITIGGVATNHHSITIGPSGAFAGVGGFVVVAPVASVPFGPATVVVGGVSFNYASGNIKLDATDWGGVAISSIPGVAASSTAVALTDASSYRPGTGFTPSSSSPGPAQDTVGFFGYGFVPPAGCGSSTGGVITLTTPAGAAFSSGPTFNAGQGGTGGASGTAKPDCNGAIFATGALGDTPWSSAATPTLQASYTPVIDQASGPANILSPTFGITPWIQAQSAPTIDYTDSTFAVTAHGFSNAELVTADIGANPMLSGGTCTTAASGACTTTPGRVQDLAAGVQAVSAMGSLSGILVSGSATSTGAVSYDPIADFAGGQTLSVDVGGAGVTTVLRTGVGFGIHGLLANTLYNVVWNAVSGSTDVASFTSTSTGGIPAPGVQFTIPSDVGGVHILDLQTSSGGSALYAGQVLSEVAPTDGPFSGAYTTAYGDMLFLTIGQLQATPSTATIGSPETLSGTGLLAGQSYVVALGTGAGTVSISAPALGTFTSTSGGTVPAGTSITLTDTPTAYEPGTVSFFSIQTAAHFHVTTASDAFAEFLLAASASLNPTSAPDGAPVTLSAHALNPGAIYDVVFNYTQSLVSSIEFTGTIVGTVAPNSLGAGSTSFNVPIAASAGTYVVQLTVASQGPGGGVVGTAVLDTPLSLTVSSRSPTTTSVSCSPGSVVAGLSSTCTATVTGSSPTGTVTWTSSSATGSFTSATCSLTLGSCSVGYSDGASGAPAIKATYGGDSSNLGSSNSFGLTVTPRPSLTTLSCAKPFHRGAAIKCTVTVTDEGSGTPITPSGTVTFSASAAGHFSSSTCALSGTGATATCAVTFTPSKMGSYKITASYAGDPAHSGSSGSGTFRVRL